MKVARWLYLSVLMVSPAVYPQGSRSLDTRISGILARTSSLDLPTREAALDDICNVISEGQKLSDGSGYSDILEKFFNRHPDQADRVKLGLIDLLKADNDTFLTKKAARDMYTENDSEHYVQAIDVVSSLNDERAIPALVGAMTTGGMATRGLLKYGEKALDPVLNQLGNPSSEMRSSAVNTGIAILRMKNDASSHARILEMIQTAMKDAEYLVRGSALLAIEGLDDRQPLASSLRDMAEHDPFIVPGEVEYPLRVRAKKLLETTVKHY